MDSPYERHSRLYLPDGDVILAAQSSASSVQTDPSSSVDRAENAQPKHVLFRVHKFLLKHHSAPLGHLFEDASVTSDETYDGVPMATMHGDRAEDLGMLLNYIYNPA